jgi:hypothetical protein
MHTYMFDNAFMAELSLNSPIFSPLPLMDPLNCNLNHMLVTMVKDLLTEDSFAASVAGLNYDIVDSVYGLEVHLHSEFSNFLLDLYSLKKQKIDLVLNMINFCRLL